MTGQDAGRRAAAIAQRIQDEYNAGFVWDEYERTRNRPALKHMIAEAIDAAVAEATKERDARLAEARVALLNVETLLVNYKHYHPELADSALVLDLHVRKALTRLRDPEATG